MLMGEYIFTIFNRQNGRLAVDRLSEFRLAVVISYSMENTAWLSMRL